ncbi:MAG: hypothetical protein RIS76_3027, partial [Verrucomicrobiota bacterium]
MEYRSAHILLSQKVKVYILTLLAIHWIAVVATGATEVLLPKAPFLPSQTNGPLAQMTTDDATQLETLRRMADAGVAPAQFALGYILESGKLLPSDSVEALKWYRAAAMCPFGKRALPAYRVIFPRGGGRPPRRLRAARVWRRTGPQGG